MSQPQPSAIWQRLISDDDMADEGGAIDELSDEFPLTLAPDVHTVHNMRLTLALSSELRLASVLLVNPLCNAVVDLDDNRTGSNVKHSRCQTCNREWVQCLGHQGHIDLAMPVINGNYASIIHQLMRTACHQCGHQLRDTGAVSHAGDETVGLFHMVPLPVLAPHASRLNHIRQSCVTGPLAVLRDDRFCKERKWLRPSDDKVDTVQPPSTIDSSQVDASIQLAHKLQQIHLIHDKWLGMIQGDPHGRSWLEVEYNPNAMKQIQQWANNYHVRSPASPEKLSLPGDRKHQLPLFTLKANGSKRTSTRPRGIGRPSKPGALHENSTVLPTAPYNVPSPCQSDDSENDQSDPADLSDAGSGHSLLDDSDPSNASDQSDSDSGGDHVDVSTDSSQSCGSDNTGESDDFPDEGNQPGASTKLQSPTTKCRKSSIGIGTQKAVDRLQLRFHMKTLHSVIAQLRRERGNLLESLRPVLIVSSAKSSKGRQQTSEKNIALATTVRQARVIDHKVVGLERIAGCTYGNLVGLVQREERRFRDTLLFLEELRQPQQRTHVGYEGQIMARLHELQQNCLFLRTCLQQAHAFIHSMVDSYHQWRDGDSDESIKRGKSGSTAYNFRTRHKQQHRPHRSVHHTGKSNTYRGLDKFDPESVLIHIMYQPFFRQVDQLPLLVQLSETAAKMYTCYKRKPLQSLVCSMVAGGCGADQMDWQLKGVAFTAAIHPAISNTSMDTPWTDHSTELLPYDVYHLLCQMQQVGNPKYAILRLPLQQLCWWVMPVAVKALRLHSSMFKHARTINYENVIQVVAKIRQLYQPIQHDIHTKPDASYFPQPSQWRADLMESPYRMTSKAYRRLLVALVKLQNCASTFMSGRDHRWTPSRLQLNSKYHKVYPKRTHSLAFTIQLTGKKKLIRRHVLGKNTNFAGRLVGVADASIPLGFIGVSQQLARTINTQEMVTPLSIDRFRRAVVHPPARPPDSRAPTIERVVGRTTRLHQDRGQQETLVSVTTQDGACVLLGDSLDHGQRVQLASRLRLGDVVTRTLKDGDNIILNRSPNLQRFSVLGRRVIVLSGQSTSLHINPLDTEPLAGDFDGDVYLFVVTTSVHGKVELHHLCSGMNRSTLIDPQSNCNVFSAIEDVAVGLHFLTSERLTLAAGHAGTILGNLVFDQPLSLQLDIPAWCEQRCHQWRVEWFDVADTDHPVRFSGKQRFQVARHAVGGRGWYPCVTTTRCPAGCVLRNEGVVTFTTLLSWIFSASRFHFGRVSRDRIQLRYRQPPRWPADSDPDQSPRPPDSLTFRHLHDDVEHTIAWMRQWLEQWCRLVDDEDVFISNGRYHHGTLTSAELGRRTDSLWTCFIRDQPPRHSFLLYHNLTALACTLNHLQPPSLSLQHIVLHPDEHNPLLAGQRKLLGESDCVGHQAEPIPTGPAARTHNALIKHLTRSQQARYSQQKRERWREWWQLPLQTRHSNMKQPMPNDSSATQWFFQHGRHDSQIERRSLNAWYLMIRSGAKGSMSKLEPVTMAGGLKMIHGDMLRPGRDGRLAAYFGNHSTLRNQGFIATSFVRGVRIHENVFQLRSGQSQASDATNEVSSAGTNTRVLIRLLCDVRLYSDGSIRDNDRHLLDFCYGSTGQLVHCQRRVRLFSWGAAADRHIHPSTQGCANIDPSVPWCPSDDAWTWWCGQSKGYEAVLRSCWREWSHWQQSYWRLGIDGHHHDPTSWDYWQLPTGETAPPGDYVVLDFNVPDWVGDAASETDARTRLGADVITGIATKLLANLQARHASVRGVVAALYLVWSLAPRRLWALCWTEANLRHVAQQLTTGWQQPLSAGENVGSLASQATSEILTQATLQLKNNAFDFYTVGLLQGVPRFAQLLQHRILPTDCCLAVGIKPGIPSEQFRTYLERNTIPWLCREAKDLIHETRWTTLASEPSTATQWHRGPVVFGHSKGLQCRPTWRFHTELDDLLRQLEASLPSSVDWQLYQCTSPASPAIQPPHTDTTTWMLELGVASQPGALVTATHTDVSVSRLLQHHWKAVCASWAKETRVSHMVWSGDTNVPLDAHYQIGHSRWPSPPNNPHTIHLQLSEPSHFLKWAWGLLSLGDRWIHNLASSSVHLIEMLYGIVAARITLENELFKMLSQVKPVDRRHCRLIAHWMTFTGTIQPFRMQTLLDRSPDVFKQASFNQNAEPLLMNQLTDQASECGRNEVGAGVFGQLSVGGTGFFTHLLER
jgi:DNA-directed RNA polymerase beta' subunit